MIRFDAEEIIKLLEGPTADRIEAKIRITSKAPGGELISALQNATNPQTRQILADIVGGRCEAAAVPILVQYLADDSSGVRSAAADALGNIGDLRAGPALLARFSQQDESLAVRHLLASALGAVSYRPAIPLLVQALDDPDPVLQGCAAWSLGVLGAAEAEDALRTALNRDPRHTYTTQRVEEALAAVELVRNAQAVDHRAALHLLVPALDRPVLRSAAAWALAHLGGPAAKTALERALNNVGEDDCYWREHLKQAITTVASSGRGAEG